MNKVALITGGSRGIGLGIARYLAREGYNLTINGLRAAEKVRDIVDELAATGIDVIYCQEDISKAKDRQSLINKVKDHFGCLNILVNNAGMAPRKRMDILDTTEESFDEVLKVNLHGPYFLSQGCARWMIEQKQSDPAYQAAIINITSVSARLASVNRGEYCISKAGLSMMSSLFAARLGEYDIPVYEIQPGIIRTDMTEPVKNNYNKRIADGLTLQKRWGTADDVGKAAAALASGRFAYSTGQVFVIDGGLTTPRL